VAGWVEFALLRRSLNQRIGRTGLPLSYIAKLWTGALAGAALGWGIKLILPTVHPMVVAGLVLVPYGLLYFAVTSAFGVKESVATVRRVLRIVGLRR